MCGIGGIVALGADAVPALRERLEVMNQLQAHRGPDGRGVWAHESGRAGLAHTRLAVIDLHTGDQPMTDGTGNWVAYNGEVYNYVELRRELGEHRFRTSSDTEVVLRAYERWGPHCVDRFRGMFSFALWDESSRALFCARDRFGIKPYYYTLREDVLYFASEIKALLPFADKIELDVQGLKDYLAFQFCLDGKTLFAGIRELPPGHTLTVVGRDVRVERYWEVYYDLDWDHTAAYFECGLRGLLEESVNLHTRSDVPLGAYVSGGLDSGIVATLASDRAGGEFLGFTGKFSLGPAYDESRYARELAEEAGFDLHELEITCADFVDNIAAVIYHLDQPVAGPGAFSQYMVSRMAARHRKVVLGGQGGDEIFGGYVRYLIAYFEQCLKAAIDGTTRSGNFVVTYESIIPNLGALRGYKPLLQEFWRDGLFEDMDHRYFRLVDRSATLDTEIAWAELGDYSPFETFKTVFNAGNVGKESYFDLMTHFDFKTLLPALLQVEDRVSMAHGLESRVPFLDTPLVELAATIPSNIKFEGGNMKLALKNAMRDRLPRSIVERTDKMGFPTPVTEWINGEAREFVMDIFSSQAAKERAFVRNDQVLAAVGQEGAFGRKLWGLLSLELWQRRFLDEAESFRRMAP